jgi:lipopolysaccharide transport system ATP-binding protein
VSGSLQVSGTISSLFEISIGFDLEATGREMSAPARLVMGMTRADLTERMDGIRDFSGLGDYLDFARSNVLERNAAATRLCCGYLHAAGYRADGRMAIRGMRNSRSTPPPSLAEFVDRTAILILATHSNEQAEKFYNRKIELNHGRIVNDEQIAGSQ